MKIITGSVCCFPLANVLNKSFICLALKKKKYFIQMQNQPLIPAQIILFSGTSLHIISCAFSVKKKRKDQHTVYFAFLIWQVWLYCIRNSIFSFLVIFNLDFISYHLSSVFVNGIFNQSFVSSTCFWLLSCHKDSLHWFASNI